jgi:hypothetical protein
MLLKVAGFDTAVKRAPTTPEIREACTAHFLPSPTLVQPKLVRKKVEQGKHQNTAKTKFAPPVSSKRR